MIAQRGRIVRHTVFAQIRGRRGKVVTLLTKNAGVERRVRQHANAKDKIGRIPVRVDKVIGQRELNV
jgi:hypothetical protein